MAIKELVIELGNQISRVWYPAGKEKSAHAQNSFMFLMPEGAITDGQIANPEDLGEFLTSQLKLHNVSDVPNVSFVIASGRIATREILLPPVKESRVADIITTNASDYFPVDMSGYHVAHNLLGQNAEKQLRVMVYAAPLALLEGYFNLAAAAKLKIRTIDYAGNAQHNIFKELNPTATSLFVYVNHNSSYLSFLNGKTLLFQRALTFGGGELVDDFLAASKHTQDGYLDAFSTLADRGRKRVALDVISEGDIRSSLNRLVMGIARSLDFFSSNYPDTPVENVILTGPCSSFLTLKDAVAAETSQNVFVMDETAEAKAYFQDATASLPFVNCIAAVMSPIDLLPPRFTQTKKKKTDKSSVQSLRLGVLSIILFVLVSLALAAISYLDLIDARDASSAMRRQISDLEYTEVIYKNYITYTNGANSFVNLRALTSSPNDELVAFLSEIELKMPSEIVIMSAACGQTDVVMNMTVPKKSDVARVLVQLRTFESLSELTLSTISERTDETGVSFVDFSVMCAYTPLTAEIIPIIGGELSEYDEYYEEDMEGVIG